MQISYGLIVAAYAVCAATCWFYQATSGRAFRRLESGKRTG
ncbi:MAG: hypothetical protein U0Z53_11195 [Blastocatellia bacterium]